MNKKTGDVAASSQDTQRQMQGEPTAAQQAGGAKRPTKQQIRIAEMRSRSGDNVSSASKSSSVSHRLRVGGACRGKPPNFDRRRTASISRVVTLSKAKWPGPRGKFRCRNMRALCTDIGLPPCAVFESSLFLVLGTNVVPALLGRNLDELENSEDCGSAGGHGNQHVRLRGASIDASKRSARLRQRFAAGRASSMTPESPLLQQHSSCESWKRGRTSPQGARTVLLFQHVRRTIFRGFPRLAHGPASC